MSLDLENLPKVTEELVQSAIQTCQTYVGDLTDRYEERKAWRAKLGVPIIGYLGYGRSGKDDAALYLSTRTDLKYGGSTSSIVLPIIAHSLDCSRETAWETRHQCRKFWFDWCNMFRDILGGDMLSKMLLGLGDFIVGLRSDIEVQAVFKNRVVTHWVWIDRPGTPVDPTVEFTWPMIQSMGGILLRNDGSLSRFHRRVVLHARMAGMPIKN